MKKLLVAALALMSLTSFANEDLSLPGAKWVAKYTDYVCDSYENVVYQPSAHSSMNLIWGNLVTDSTLDNGLVKATFTTRNGNLCKYSAILLADNALKTIRLVESKAFAVASSAISCDEGKDVVDALLENNTYLYAGKPHNVTIMVPFAGACKGKGQIGVNFRVAGRIQK